MTDQSEPGSPERLLRPLRRELSIELANALLRLQADGEVQARYENWPIRIRKCAFN